jgi:hypothetical protein
MCKYPAFKAEDNLEWIKAPSLGLSPRTVGNLAYLGLLFATILLFCWLRWTANTIERTRPLDFRLVTERYDSVGFADSRKKVLEILGPPTTIHTVDGLDVDVGTFCMREQKHRDFDVDSDSLWLKWTDPKNAGKCVMVCLIHGRVGLKLKEGF